MKKINIKSVPLTLTHNPVPKKALIKVGNCQSHLQTVNNTNLKPNKGLNIHKHKNCEEIYYFLEGNGEIDNQK